MHTCSRACNRPLPAVDSARTSKAVVVPCQVPVNHAERAMAVCTDCIKGSLDEGAPKGEDTTLAGFPCYVSKPAASAANQCAIILATDVFGYKLINARLIADVFADNGYLCAVPDYFKGEPLNMQLLELFESLPTRSIFGKITGYVQLAVQFLGLSSWLKRHPVQHAVDVVTAVAAELKKEHGMKQVGLQGYCYGGKVGVLMAAKRDCIDAVCSAHPGLIKVPEDIQPVEVPVLFICAESDAQFPEKMRTAALQVLEDKAPGLGTGILYPGTKHGFAVRGDKQHPAVNAARQDALKQGLAFFNQHLAGVAPQPHKLDTADPAPVGMRIALAPRVC